MSRLNLFFEKRPISSFLLLAILLAGLQGFNSFCSKVSCNGFSDSKFDLWFPYQQGQTIHFLSEQNDTSSLFISYTNKTKASTISGGFGSHCSIPTAIIQSSRVGSLSNSLYLNYVAFSSSDSTKNINLNFDGFMLLGGAITDTGIAIRSGNTNVQSSYNSFMNIQGTIYYNVQLIQLDTTETYQKNVGVYKIWLAKNTGILAYQEYPSLLMWVKQ